MATTSASHLLTTVVFLLGLVLLVWGEKSTEGCRKSSLITFNTGLDPLVFSHEKRRSLVPKALAETSADALCLQEVYYEEDVANIVEALRSKYPHSFSELHQDEDKVRSQPETNADEFVCTADDVAKVEACFAKCKDAGSRRLGCAKTACPGVIFSLTQLCRTCLFISDNVEEQRQRCMSKTTPHNRFNLLGLMLLSKHRMANTSVTYYFPKDISMMYPTAFIQSDVEGVSKVVCTHLTAMMGEYLEEKLSYGSWLNQQLAEIKIINSTFRDVPNILLGDLNTSPGNSGYQELMAMGYKSPYDLLNLPPTHMGGGHLDHVMSFQVSNYSAKRILEAYNGEQLSDHRGVLVDGCF